MAQEYIGSLISLTSKSQVSSLCYVSCSLLMMSGRLTWLDHGPTSQIRYQGILNQIDPEAATISLEKGKIRLSSMWRDSGAMTDDGVCSALVWNRGKEGQPPRGDPTKP